MDAVLTEYLTLGDYKTIGIAFLDSAGFVWIEIAPIHYNFYT